MGAFASSTLCCCSRWIPRALMAFVNMTGEWNPVGCSEHLHICQNFEDGTLWLRDGAFMTFGTGTGEVPQGEHSVSWWWNDVLAASPCDSLEVEDGIAQRIVWAGGV